MSKRNIKRTTNDIKNRDCGKGREGVDIWVRIGVVAGQKGLRQGHRTHLEDELSHCRGIAGLDAFVFEREKEKKGIQGARTKGEEEGGVRRGRMQRQGLFFFPFSLSAMGPLVGGTSGDRHDH
jgi:hypothetical protein